MNHEEKEEQTPMEEFIEYDKENPGIWKLFEDFTIRAINRGYKNFGAAFVVNIIRWETKVGYGDEEFKVRNAFAPFYSRKFMKLYPQYEGFFRKSRSVADLEEMPV